MAQEFRKDLQFIRGVAIASVWIFHIRPDLLPAGFLGVDMFFVLSGFLMCNLYKDIGLSAAKSFLIRRARRILPAYTAVLLATTAAMALITLPQELGEFVRHALYSVFMTPNIGFWMDNSYFDKAAMKPILHFWSLGVELQFYLVFPLIIWLHRRHWLATAALTAASVVACMVVTGISPKTSFFLTPLRIWQFMFGFAIAHILTSARGASMCHGKTWLGLAGLGVALALMTMPLSEAQHPKYHALLFTVATAGVIAFGLPRLVLANNFGRAMVILGDYSYSIYLVHFPVIILWFYRPFHGNNFPQPGLADIAAVVSMTLVLSVLLFHFIERPLRAVTDVRRYSLIQGGMLTGALAVLMLAPVLQRQAFPPREIVIFDALNDRSTYRCGKIARLLADAQSCNLTPPAQADAQRFLLVGNSHADSIKYTMANVAAAAGASLRLMKENCSLGQSSCEVASVAREVKEQDINTVILHGSPGSFTADQVRVMVDKGAELGFKVILIDPVPVWPVDIPEALYRAVHYGDVSGLPRQSLQDYRTLNADFLAGVSTIAAPNFAHYAVDSLLCTPDCAYTESATGKPLYFDSSHLTLTGSQRLLPIFAKIFGARGSYVAACQRGQVLQYDIEG